MGVHLAGDICLYKCFKSVACVNAPVHILIIRSNSLEKPPYVTTRYKISRLGW